MKAIFDTRPATHYKDAIESRYHFPARYLSEAQRTISDWIIFRQTRRGSGKSSYVAITRVEDVVPDREDATHFYALLSSYSQFYQKVPFRKPGDSYWEDSLKGVASNRVGAAIRGKSVRVVSDLNYIEIVYTGFAELLSPRNFARLELHDSLNELYDPTRAPELQDALTRERVVQTLTSNRILRDASFRGLVLNAYEDTCAITGLRIKNGLERTETQAAHIRPVADDGPDIVRNGLALSATCHWTFDRHLISLTDDCELLISPNLPSKFKRLLPPEGEKVFIPSNENERPNPVFLAHHREKFEPKWANPQLAL